MEWCGANCFQLVNGVEGHIVEGLGQDPTPTHTPHGLARFQVNRVHGAMTRKQEESFTTTTTVCQTL